ncbi:hypothetical protein OSB04_015301 [Centaurea solstitialis]|uniref:Uncharacterized protein n=1 Tax=Centaurea solstitialis TaxID=347529 RepID=A0AA38WK05_9ASTR|nr:hypothetical protein OSB04_015301 [Centaurea solstitialis]
MASKRQTSNRGKKKQTSNKVKVKRNSNKGKKTPNKGKKTQKEGEKTPLTSDNVIFKPCNYVALLDLGHYLKNEKLREKYCDLLLVANFLRKCPLNFALTYSPKMSKSLLGKFWASCKYDQTSKTIHASVLSKGDVSFTVDDLRRVLDLPTYSPYQNIVSEDDSSDAVKSIMGYVPDPKVKGHSALYRTYMGGGWHSLFSYLIHCLSSKTGGTDQAHAPVTQLAHTLIFQRKIDFAAYFFGEMVKKMGPFKSHSVPFVRFISMLIADKLGSLLPTDDAFYDLKVSKVGIVMLKKAKKPHERPLPTSMVSFATSPDLTWGELSLESTRASQPSKSKRRRCSRLPTLGSSSKKAKRAKNTSAANKAHQSKAVDIGPTEPMTSSTHLTTSSVPSQQDTDVHSESLHTVDVISESLHDVDVHSESLHTVDVHCQSLHAVDVHSESLHAVDVHSESLHAVDVHSESLHAVDVHSESLHAVDVHSESLHAVDVHSESLHAVDVHSESLHAVDVHSESLHAVDVHSDSLHTVDVHSDSLHTVDVHCESLHTVDVHSDSLHTVDVHSDFSPLRGLPPPPHTHGLLPEIENLPNIAGNYASFLDELCLDEDQPLAGVAHSDISPHANVDDIDIEPPVDTDVQPHADVGDISASDFQGTDGTESVVPPSQDRRTTLLPSFHIAAPSPPDIMYALPRELVDLFQDLSTQSRMLSRQQLTLQTTLSSKMDDLITVVADTQRHIRLLEARIDSLSATQVTGTSTTRTTILQDMATLHAESDYQNTVCKDIQQSLANMHTKDTHPEGKAPRTPNEILAEATATKVAKNQVAANNLVFKAPTSAGNSSSLLDISAQDATNSIALEKQFDEAKRFQCLVNQSEEAEAHIREVRIKWYNEKILRRYNQTKIASVQIKGPPISTNDPDQIVLIIGRVDNTVRTEKLLSMKDYGFSEWTTIRDFIAESQSMYRHFVLDHLDHLVGKLAMIRKIYKLSTPIDIAVATAGRPVDL